MRLESVTTAMKCPFCGRPLELLEDDNYVLLGCASCLRYVVASKCELARRFVNRRRRLFDWRSLMSELYALYASAR